MPTIPTNNESPSVFDPLYEQLIKRFIGSRADISDIAGLSGPLGIAAPLIAKAPLPRKGIRNQVLQEFVKEQLPDVVMSPVQFAFQKYPRIMSHILDIRAPREIPNVIKDAPKRVVTMASHTATPKKMAEQEGFTSLIDISPEAIAKAAPNRPLDEEIANSFGHELTHAAQIIWNRDKFLKNIPVANSSIEAYRADPFEEGARRAADNFVNKMYYPAASKKLKKPEPVPQAPEGAIDRILKLFTGE